MLCAGSPFTCGSVQLRAPKPADLCATVHRCIPLPLRQPQRSRVLGGLGRRWLTDRPAARALGCFPRPSCFPTFRMAPRHDASVLSRVKKALTWDLTAVQPLVRRNKLKKLEYGWLVEPCGRGGAGERVWWAESEEVTLHDAAGLAVGGLQRHSCRHRRRPDQRARRRPPLSAPAGRQTLSRGVHRAATHCAARWGARRGDATGAWCRRAVTRLSCEVDARRRSRAAPGSSTLTCRARLTLSFCSHRPHAAMMDDRPTAMAGDRPTAMAGAG